MKTQLAWFGEHFIADHALTLAILSQTETKTEMVI
jgi:hypothetical protein